MAAELSLADALNVLSSWEGQEVHVLVMAGAQVYPFIAEMIGALGGVRVNDVLDGEGEEGIATYLVGDNAEFAVTASAFERATVERCDRTLPDPPYEELTIYFDGWQLTVDQPPQDPDWLAAQGGGA
jgi:hypothetical protein